MSVTTYLSSKVYTIAATTAVAFVMAWAIKVYRLRSSLPPGPRRWPIIGNILDFPKEYEWLKYDEWTKKYGDVVYVEALGQPSIILGSVTAVNDLLDRRSANYSDRGRAVMVSELMGFGYSFSTLSQGEKWRTRRKLFSAFFTPDAITAYHHLQVRYARSLAHQLLSEPNDFRDLSRRMIADMVAELVYGLQVPEEAAKYHDIVDEVVNMLALAWLPGTYLVNVFPALKHVPAWLPGAGFQRVATHCRRLIETMLQRPLQMVKDVMASGQSSSCMTAQLIEAGEDEEVVKDVAGIMYLGAVDTTFTSILAFFAAMMSYPVVQTKAQAELDAIVGLGRLPGLEDRANLPYVNALLLEVLRWQPPARIAIPHVNTEEDIYKGYRIPKGSVILPNVWALLHDETDYPEPDSFKPERFLTYSDGKLLINGRVRDPRSIVFGFGRRICPGRHFAEDMLFAVVTTMLASFNISAPADSGPLPIKVDVTSGLLSIPLPFQCEIKPRAPHVEELLSGSIE